MRCYAPRPCARRRDQAAALVGGMFLAGVSLRSSAAFADWAATRAEGLHEQACELLVAVAGDHERRGACARALPFARRALELEPWREAAHRAVMRCLATTGDRAGALRQYQICERVLADELGIEPEPEARVLRDAIRSGSVPASGAAPGANLPPQRTRFIGRTAHLDRLFELVAREGVVTLTGPGGAGKTRLALRLAEELAPDLPGRLWFVELDRVEDGAQVLGTIARALGVGDHPEKDPLDLVADRIGEGAALLLLDNCEHVRVDCARAVARLTRACPALAILATSREPLRVTGESVLPVPPLGLPLADAPERDIAAAEAVDLFVDRVQRVAPTFALCADNARAVAEVCRRLDGLPLAIELAASWVRLLGPAALLRRLDQPLALTSPPMEDAAPRHRSLREVLDWSHALLGERERVLLRRLSAFPGGWTLDAAETVCADPPAERGPLARGDVLDALAGLFDRSLVVAEEEPDGVHYRMLETVRQYAQEQLEAADDPSAVRARHAAYFLELADTAAPLLRGPDQLAWRDRLERERRNLLVALDWLGQRGEVASALRLVVALTWFWHTRGYWREGADQAGRALALPGAREAPEYGRALAGAGLFAFDLGQLGRAAELLHEGLALVLGVDLPGEIETLNPLGLVELGQGNAAAAQARFERAVALAEQLGDRWSVGRALWNLAELRRRCGDLTSARDLIGRAADELRAVGAMQGVGMVLGEMARIAQADGERAEARRLGRASLEVHRQSSIRFGVVSCLRGLAAIDAEEGNVAAATALLEEALRSARDLGMPDTATEVEQDLAALATDSSEPASPTVPAATLRIRRDRPR